MLIFRPSLLQATPELRWLYHVVCPHTKYHIVCDGGHKALCPPSIYQADHAVDQLPERGITEQPSWQKEYDEWKSFIAWWVGMGKPELRYDVADPTKFVYAENE